MKNNSVLMDFLDCYVVDDFTMKTLKNTLEENPVFVIEHLMELVLKNDLSILKNRNISILVDMMKYVRKERIKVNQSLYENIMKKIDYCQHLRV